MHGAILSKYQQTGIESLVGAPLTEEAPIAGGHVSYFAGNLCGSTGPSNSGSAIYYSGGTGAHQVGGCIYNWYWQHGEASLSELGYPVSDTADGQIPGGWVTYFKGLSSNVCGTPGPSGSGAAIYYSGGNGAYEVLDCIYATYLSWNGPAGALGFPVTDQYTLSNGGVESDFQNGYITADPTTGQTTVTIYPPCC